MGSLLWVRSLLFGDPSRATAVTGPVHGLFGWVEAGCWVVLAVAGLVMVVRLRPWTALPRVPRTAWLVLAVAAGARLAVPWLPYNWYFGIGNHPLGTAVYTKASTYLPLPLRLVGFELGLGSSGITVLNVILGVAAVLLVWHAARRAYGEGPAKLLGLLLAVTPMYVRLSASDTSQILVLFLWSCAVVAFAALRGGSGGRLAQVVLFAATLLACPIRLEACLMLPSVPLLVAGDLAGWRDILKQWRRFLAYWVALAIGAAVALAYHAGSIPVHTVSAGALAATLVPALILRLTGLISIGPVTWLPPLVAIPTVYLLARYTRGRRWRELLSTFGPLAVLGLPFIVSGNFVFGDLSTSSYNVIPVVFVLAAAAKGLDEMIRRFRDGLLLRRAWTRVLVSALAIPAAWLCFVIPYRWTYVYQEEYRFLRDSLPRGPATIAAIWDPRSQAGDYDCCLSLPYPTFVGERPDLRWVILGTHDLDRGGLDTLAVDYYYPGTLIKLDREKPTPWSLATLMSESDRLRLQPDREHLRRLARLDEAIGRSLPLEAAARRTIPLRRAPLHGRGTTGVSFGFPGDDVELVLYRVVR